jgi:hypothetical protein
MFQSVSPAIDEKNKADSCLKADFNQRMNYANVQIYLVFETEIITCQECKGYWKSNSTMDLLIFQT